MSDRVDLDELERLTNEATLGPWKWEDRRYTKSDGPLPVLVGIGGDENYSYERQVIEAEHNGECGCRSACVLDLEVGPNDMAFIAAARQAVPALIAQIRGDDKQRAEVGGALERALAEVDELRAEVERLKGFLAESERQYQAQATRVLAEMDKVDELLAENKRLRSARVGSPWAPTIESQS